MTFPAHWFGVSRSGTIVTFGIVPCTCTVDANQWRLYPDGLRTHDLIEIVATLKSEPQGMMLILAVVPSLSDAVYLMESARMALQAWDLAAREKAFGSPVIPPPTTGPTVPSEPLPAGHPDSYSMDDLRADLQLPAPITNYCNAPLPSMGGAGVHLCVYEHGHAGHHSWGGT